MPLSQEQQLILRQGQDPFAPQTSVPNLPDTNISNQASTVSDAYASEITGASGDPVSKATPESVPVSQADPLDSAMSAVDAFLSQPSQIPQSKEKPKNIEIAKQNAINDGYDPEVVNNYANSLTNKQEISAIPGKVIMGDTTVTARGGQPYPGSNELNRGTDFAGSPGTPVILPTGQWEVVDSVNNITRRTPGNKTSATNYGWGNSVKVRNKTTGETMRFSHMQPGSVPTLKPGETLRGGVQIGAIGNTGNTRGDTGNHLDIEMTDQRGRLIDVLNSPYGRYFQ